MILKNRSQTVIRKGSAGLAILLMLAAMISGFVFADWTLIPDIIYLWLVIIGMLFLPDWLGDPQSKSCLIISDDGLRFGNLEPISWAMVERISIRRRLLSSKKTVRFHLRHSSRQLLHTPLGRRNICAFEPDDDEVAELFGLAGAVAPHVVLPRRDESS